MSLLTTIVILIVAILHILFFVVEAILWETKGPKIFTSWDPKTFQATKNLMQNQGVYNAFLAAGLIWSRLINDIVWSENIALFFLICVVIAAVVGAITVSRWILIVQGIPAMIGLTLVLI